MPKSTPPRLSKKRPYHHGHLRSAMIDAALTLISQHGPRGFSLSQAAKLAGVTVGAPYRHFPDKEALIAAIAAQGFSELESRIEAAAAANPGDPYPRLIALGEAYVQFAVDQPSHFQVMFDSRIHRRRDPAVDAPAHRAFEILAATIHQIAGQNDALHDETLIVATWSMVHGQAIFALDGCFSNMEFHTPPRALIRNSLKWFAESFSLNRSSPGHDHSAPADS